MLLGFVLNKNKGKLKKRTSMAFEPYHLHTGTSPEYGGDGGDNNDESSPEIAYEERERESFSLENKKKRKKIKKIK